jgi:lipoprotein NlpI
MKLLAKVFAAALLAVSSSAGSAVAQVGQLEYSWCTTERSPTLELKIRACTALIRYNENDALVFYNRGTAYYDRYKRGIAYDETRLYRLAIDDFSQATKLNPNYTDAFFRRGIVYLEAVSKGVEWLRFA